jgi:serine/threonine protein phosphatase PrpC
VFSKELCQNIYENFHQYELHLKIRDKGSRGKFSTSYDYNDYDIKENIYSETVVKKLLIKSSNTVKSLGSSTCTILLLDRQSGRVYTSYIGDSIYMILRYDEKKCKYYKEFKSEEQMHNEYFNTPFQVGKEGDDPENAITNSHQLVNNDIIISATDGLWDNLEVEKIIEIVNENSKYYPKIDTQEISTLLAEQAEIMSNLK